MDKTKIVHPCCGEMTDFELLHLLRGKEAADRPASKAIKFMETGLMEETEESTKGLVEGLQEQPAELTGVEVLNLVNMRPKDAFLLSACVSESLVSETVLAEEPLAGDVPPRKFITTAGLLEVLDATRPAAEEEEAADAPVA